MNSSRLPFFFLIGLLAGSPAGAAPKQDLNLTSPDGNISVAITLGDHLAFDVQCEDRPVLQHSTLSLKVDDTILGLAPQLISATPHTRDRVLQPEVHQKSATIREHYNELHLEFAGNYAVTFRAYNEGVAYRWSTSLPAPKVKVYAEEVAYRFTGSHFA